MTSAISDDDAGYAYDIVKRICTEVGPGLPGSSQERAREVLSIEPLFNVLKLACEWIRGGGE